jgi:hypothetical protein
MRRIFARCYHIRRYIPVHYWTPCRWHMERALRYWLGRDELRFLPPCMKSFFLEPPPLWRPCQAIRLRNSGLLISTTGLA